VSEERGLSPERVSELVGSGAAQLIDVRTDEEYEAGHIAQALHLPLDVLPSRASELDRSKPLVLYCRGGDRSGAAAEAFAASGWDVRHLSGGLLAWVDRGLPLEPDGGEVARPSGLPPR
jgi:rhodanese-related sulfurtransferase